MNLRVVRSNDVVRIDGALWPVLLVGGSLDDIAAVHALVGDRPVLVVPDVPVVPPSQGGLVALGHHPSIEATRLVQAIASHLGMLRRDDPRTGGVIERMAIAVDRHVDEKVRAKDREIARVHALIDSYLALFEEGVDPNADDSDEAIDENTDAQDDAIDALYTLIGRKKPRD